MVRQYPDIVEILISQNASLDNNGDWVASGHSIYRSKCRVEGNGAGNGDLITLADNTTYKYNALIQLPKSCPNIALNTTIRVKELDGTIKTFGQVKKYHKSQLHSRIWV